MKAIKFLKSNFVPAVAIVTACVTMSFKMAATPDQAATVHYYVSEDMSEGAFRSTANWDTVNEDGINCGSLRFRPCKITVPTGSTLGAVLGARTNSQVLDISEGYKPAP